MRARCVRAGVPARVGVAAAPACVGGDRRSCPPRPRAIPSRTRSARRGVPQAAALRGRHPPGQARARARRALRAGDGGAGQGVLLPAASTSWRRASSTSPSRSTPTTPSASTCSASSRSRATTRISATAAFKKATELDRRYGNAWDNLAAQYLFAKNYDGALDAAQKATQLLPSFAKAWNNLGSAHRGKQQYAEAESAYKRATQLDPNYADAYFNLGILYLDAKQMPGTDLITKLNTSINYLNRYKQLAGYRLTKDDPADTYIAEARTRHRSRAEAAAAHAEAAAARASPRAPAPGRQDDG